MSGLKQQARVMDAVMAEQQQPPKQRTVTLFELAQKAIDAAEAESKFNASNDCLDLLDRRDIELWDAKNDAVDDFKTALQRETGIAGPMLEKLTAVLP